MITYDGYTIEQQPKKNRVVIYLPQTSETITSTLSAPVERRVRLTEEELVELLMAAVKMYQMR